MHHTPVQWERQTSHFAYYSSTSCNLHFTSTSCICTAGKATQSCAYASSRSYTLNYPTHHVPTQRERPQSPILRLTSGLRLSFVRHTMRPHSGKSNRSAHSCVSQKGNPAQRQSHNLRRTLSSLTHPGSTQRERQPSSASVVGQATKPYGNHSPHHSSHNAARRP